MRLCNLVGSSPVLSPRPESKLFAPRFCPHRKFYWTFSVSALLALTTFLALADLFQPSIDYLDRDPANTNRVRIHFGTQAGHTYFLQYVTNLASTNWSNIFTGYNYPFSNHYIFPDTRTNASRYYRLRATTP